MSIIKVENLSKKYIIGHDKQASGMYQYQSLRDTLAHTARGVYQRLRHPLSPNQENTELEEFWALKDINFEINQGDRVGIIGRNGAGKSTLLKILSRITEPTTGKITIKGRVASLLEVGTGFHPELSGRENIYLNGAVLGMHRCEIRKKFDEIIAFAEVEKFLDTPVKRYSSGMYVRLAFAVAAHLEPEILLVDEVLAVGDAQFQKKCLGKMEDVSKEGRTVIFVSHNMSVINSLCNNAIFLNSGETKYIGNVDNAINKYLNIQNNDIKLTTIFKKTDSPVEIHKIEITQNSKSTEVLYWDVPIVISVKYTLKKTMKGINMFLNFYRNNQHILSSYDTDECPSLLNVRKKGVYEISYTIPCKILKPGFYTVRIGAGVIGVKSYASHPESLLFELISKSTEMPYHSISYGDNKINIPIKWELTKE